jgi:hypothetical protein
MLQTGNVGRVAITVQVQLWWVSARGAAVSILPAASKRHAELLMLGNLIAQGVNPNAATITARPARQADLDKMRSWADGGDPEAQRIMKLCAGYRETGQEPEPETCEQIELFAS